MSTRIAYFDNAKFLLILLAVIDHAADFVVDDSRAMQALFVFI